jgi:predicted Zn-ribbon and HTH transcriptional regulator
MPGLHKIKCSSCGTMFMSEIKTAEKCPGCSKEVQDNMQHGSIRPRDN